MDDILFYVDLPCCRGFQMNVCQHKYAHNLVYIKVSHLPGYYKNIPQRNQHFLLLKCILILEYVMKFVMSEFNGSSLLENRVDQHCGNIPTRVIKGKCVLQKYAFEAETIIKLDYNSVTNINIVTTVLSCI